MTGFGQGSKGGIAKMARMERGIRIFLLVWFGQSVSLLGSGLTGFALGVWVYQRTGSVTQFSLISLFSVLPGIIMSPLAGALVDRWDRRRAMMLSDAGSACGTLAIALLLFTRRLEIWHIYAAMGFSSACSAFQWPAYTAATTLLVPKQHLGRASGLVQVGQSVSEIAAPLLAGFLVLAIKIQGIILIDFATFLFSLLTLATVRLPRPPAPVHGSDRGSLWRDAAYGWTYIWERPGLFGLLLFFAAINLTTGLSMVLLTPLVLGFASAAGLGLVLSIGGAGMLAGSIVLSAWGGPKMRIRGLLGFTLVFGAALILAGLRPHLALVAGALFALESAGPILNGCSQAIWQSKTAPEVQGRVFAVRRMIAWSSGPLAFVIAGPLADKVFGPLLMPGGPLAGSLGRLLGVGPGRGIGLLYLITGFLTVLIAAVAYANPRVRRLEEELPDALADTAPTGAALPVGIGPEA